MSFSGPSTPAEFNQTQTRLAADYGQMPPPAQFEGYVLSSRKKISHFVVLHSLSESSEAQSERFILYVGKGGENLLNRKYSGPTTNKH